MSFSKEFCEQMQVKLRAFKWSFKVLCVNMTLTSVIKTRSSVIYTRRVRFPHAKCDFYMKSVISTRSVISTFTNVIKVWFQHAKEWFVYAKYDVHTHSLILKIEFISKYWKSCVGNKISKASLMILVTNFIEIATKWIFCKAFLNSKSSLLTCSIMIL
jgi:hypothetical protein